MTTTNDLNHSLNFKLIGAQHVNPKEFQGFILIYSTLRLASFITMRFTLYLQIDR